jgi:4-nitrophenol 2-monooxygenase / 4-nitrocatechol 4-monooxygenase, reductase component
MTQTMSRRLSADEFRDVIGRFASGVTVITTAVDGVQYGTTASAISSLSLEPPMVLICMNESSSTGQAVGRSATFAMNILGEDQGEIARRFASKAPHKFEDGLAVSGPSGLPLLADALASLECRVTEQVRGGTHIVFLAEVEAATARSGTPLAYFRGQFGRLELIGGDDAYDAIRTSIMNGEITAGEKLDIRELAEKLSSAVAPLHVALGRLSAEGLIEQRPDGFAVPPISWEAVDDALSSRCAIELGVVDMTVGRIGPDELGRLRETLETWTPVRTGEAALPWRERHEQSMGFHETMVSLAGSERLLVAYRHIAVPSVLARAFGGYVLSERDEAFGDEHRAVVAAYEDGRLDLAREIVLRHTARIREAAREVLLTAGSPAAG